MKISSNHQLLDRISKHEVGIKYPSLIPCIAFNILIQRDKCIFNPEYSDHFDWWFRWDITKEGHEYWMNIAHTLPNTYPNHVDTY